MHRIIVPVKRDIEAIIVKSSNVMAFGVMKQASVLIMEPVCPMITVHAQQPMEETIANFQYVMAMYQQIQQMYVLDMEHASTQITVIV